MNRYLIFPCIGLTALFTGWIVWGPTPEYSGDASIHSTDVTGCLLYTSPSPRDQRGSRMPSSA